MDGRAKVPDREKLDRLAEKWAEVRRRAEWVKEPEVQRDDWDEARLRALCAKHGWEFEWKTEDGERRRRAREIGALRTTAGVTEASRVMRGQSSGGAVEPKTHALPDGALLAVNLKEAGELVAGMATRKWREATAGFNRGITTAGLAGALGASNRAKATN